MKPVMAAAAASTEAREEELVAGAQAGSIEAFEALFRRYRDRIASFVRGSVRDEGRTEDLVQEIFFSAHSSLASLEQPSAFRAWLYQIARNACLDEARRKSRQDELILGWEEFPPPDERIVIHHQDADRVLSQKEELSDLTQALDGLPQSQHEALVLRELEGMSYDEIGRRMRLSRHAVESVLFRARRGLRGEYSEIQTGRRCRRMQALMGQIAEGMGDLRERRKLLRHMRDCSPCRREAAALGLSGLAVPSDERRGLERAFSRVAAFLPLPAFFSRRAGEADPLAGASASSFAAQAQTAAVQFSAVGGDHAVSVVHKAAAVVAAVAVASGGGVAMDKAGVKLPVEIPVLESIAAKKPTGPADGAKSAAGTKKLAPDPKTEVKRAEAAVEASPAGAATKAPAQSAPTSATPPTAPPASTTPSSTSTPPPAASPTETKATGSTPPNSQTFTSEGSPPPTESTVVVEPPAEPPPPVEPAPVTEPVPDVPPDLEEESEVLVP